MRPINKQAALGTSFAKHPTDGREAGPAFPRPTGAVERYRSLEDAPADVLQRIISTIVDEGRSPEGGLYQAYEKNALKILHARLAALVDARDMVAFLRQRGVLEECRRNLRAALAEARDVHAMAPGPR